MRRKSHESHSVWAEKEQHAAPRWEKRQIRIVDVHDGASKRSVPSPSIQGQARYLYLVLGSRNDAPSRSTDKLVEWAGVCGGQGGSTAVAAQRTLPAAELGSATEEILSTLKRLSPTGKGRLGGRLSHNMCAETSRDVWAGPMISQLWAIAESSLQLVKGIEQRIECEAS